MKILHPNTHTHTHIYIEYGYIHTYARIGYIHKQGKNSRTLLKWKEVKKEFKKKKINK